MNDMIEVEGREIIFENDRTVLETMDGDLYVISPIMQDGEKMDLAFFHNHVFPRNGNDPILQEDEKALRN